MVAGRRNVSMMRLGRCVAFLAAAAFLLPFTILLMVADQQYNLTYSSKRVFYQESDFYKINGTYYATITAITSPTISRTKVNKVVAYTEPANGKGTQWALWDVY